MLGSWNVHLAALELATFQDCTVHANKHEGPRLPQTWYVQPWNINLQSLLNGLHRAGDSYQRVYSNVYIHCLLSSLVLRCIFIYL